MTFQGCFLQFRFIWQSGFREDFFSNQLIRNKNCLWQSCLPTDRNYISNLYKGLSKDVSYQILIHLAKLLQRRRFFRNQPIRNKYCLWRPCLLTNWNYMNNLYRGPFTDASYQILIHLAKRLQWRRFFRNQLIRNKNCLWWPCLLTDWDKMSNLYKRTFHRCFLPSFGSFGNVVSEEKIFRNSTNQKQESPVVAMFVNGIRTK